MTVGEVACEIFYALSPNQEQAQTVSEILLRLPRKTPGLIQSGLYTLMKRSFVTRRIRPPPTDARFTVWEYWRRCDQNVLLKRGVDVSDILDLLPTCETCAMDVKHVACRLGVPNSTVRDALNRLRNANVVASIPCYNDHNKIVHRYWRV